MQHEPLAYITGTRDFWTITLNVAPGVLIPRPDSETLIEAAVAHFGNAGPRRVLDLGTGSGALLLAALAQWPEAKGLGLDASDGALSIAVANAVALCMADRATFQKGDWADGLSAQFDLILCNPPYVETTAILAPDVADFEPASALYAGVDGLDDYRRIIPQLPSLIAPGGLIAMEIGATQADAVKAIFNANGFPVTCAHDLAGRPRALLHFALGFGAQPD
jgi:release factor glutamine methyltransferase